MAKNLILKTDFVDNCSYIDNEFKEDFGNNRALWKVEDTNIVSGATCEIFRLQKISKEGTSEQNLIVKSFLINTDNDNQQKLMFWKREIQFYKDITNNDQLSSSSIHVLPKLFAIYESNVAVMIVLEDLTTKGYYIYPTGKGLPYQQMVDALHGAYIFKNQLIRSKVSFEKHKSCDLDSISIMCPLFQKNFPVFAAQLSHENFDLKKLTEAMLEQLSCTEFQLTGHSHGDYWLSNIFFQQNPKRDSICGAVKVVDWQFYMCDSDLVYDFVNILTSSASTEALLEHRKDLFNLIYKLVQKLVLENLDYFGLDSLELIKNEDVFMREIFSKSLLRGLASQISFWEYLVKFGYDSEFLENFKILIEYALLHV